MNPTTHLSKRIRYVAGAFAGAAMATSLVVLGASLDHGDGTNLSHKLTAVESDVPEATAPPATEPATAPQTAATVALPTQSEVPERVVVVEKRVTAVEKRVAVIEATTTTTIGYSICPAGTANAGSYRENGHCEDTYATTTTTPTTVDTRDPRCPRSTASTSCTPDGVYHEPQPTTTTTHDFSPGPEWTRVDCSEPSATPPPTDPHTHSTLRREYEYREPTPGQCFRRPNP